MIEVEKKFQPTEEQLVVMLEGAEFLGEVILHDIYYDYSDYRLLKQDVRLRNRNRSFELKIGKSAGVAEEIEDEKDIAKYFSTEDLNEFVAENLLPIIEFENKRKGYLKEGFDIGLDEMDFGLSMCEIELKVETEGQIKEAEEKIINFAKKYGFENQKAIPKRREYLRLFKPEVYKELYEDK